MQLIEAERRKVEEKQAECVRQQGRLQDRIGALSMEVKRLQKGVADRQVQDLQRSEAARRQVNNLMLQAQQHQFEEDTIAGFNAKINELEGELKLREEEAESAESAAVMEAMEAELVQIKREVGELSTELRDAQELGSVARVAEVEAQEAEKVAKDEAAKVRSQMAILEADKKSAEAREERANHAAAAAREETAANCRKQTAEREASEATLVEELKTAEMAGTRRMQLAAGADAAVYGEAISATVVPGAENGGEEALGRRLADELMLEISDGRIVQFGTPLGNGAFGSVIQGVIYDQHSHSWKFSAAILDLCDGVFAQAQMLSVQPDQPDQALLSRLATMAARVHDGAAAVSSQRFEAGLPCAVKRFAREDPFLDEERALRLIMQREEVLASGSFLHPDLVLRSLFVHLPSMCIGYELAATDLAHILIDELGAPRGMTNAETRLVCEQLCLGLAHLHGLHIAHRDIKPDNILLTVGRDIIASMCAPDGSPVRKDFVKIGDFGLCEDVYPETMITDETDQCGTFVYCPPEVIEQLEPIDNFNPPPMVPASPHRDLWSAGMVICECLYGQNLFAAKNIGVSSDDPEENKLEIDQCVRRWRGYEENQALYEEFGREYIEFRHDPEIAPRADEFPEAGAFVNDTLEVMFALMASVPSARLAATAAAERLAPAPPSAA